MSFAKLLAASLLVLVATGCKPDAQPAPTSTPAAPTGGVGATYARQTWPLPAAVGSAQPDLVATPDGRLLLSWINSVPGRRNVLRFVALGDNGLWQSQPRTIVVGNSLIASWADTPHILATADGALWVHWLQKTPAGGESADIMLSRSTDGGFNWSAPMPVNDDGTATEHGFVSLWPQTRDRLGIAWLDGRAKAGNGRAGNANPDGTIHGGKARDGSARDADKGQVDGEGSTALRAAFFDGTLRRSDETQLDAMTCECCQTAAAITARGPLVAYRDRTAEEIRDIAVVRFDNDAWTAPGIVHADGWSMKACPVNGPDVAADGNHVVVAWYTAADDKPMVKIARSDDAGDSFAKPRTVDQGDAVQGRVAVAMDAQQVWMLWVREDAQGQSLWLARYPTDLSRQLQRVQVTRLQGRGRGTGFAQIALRNGNAYVVWTDVTDGAPRLHGATFTAQATPRPGQ